MILNNLWTLFFYSTREVPSGLLGASEWDMHLVSASCILMGIYLCNIPIKNVSRQSGALKRGLLFDANIDECNKSGATLPSISSAEVCDSSK